MTFLSKLGRESFADMALKTWTDAGVTPVVTQSDDNATGTAYIFIEEATRDNAIIICPGVAATIAISDVESNAELIDSAAAFMTQLKQPLDAAVRSTMPGGRQRSRPPARAMPSMAASRPRWQEATTPRCSSLRLCGSRHFDRAARNRSLHALFGRSRGTLGK